VAAPEHIREVAEGYDEAAAFYDDRHTLTEASRRRNLVLDGIQLRAAGGARRLLEIGCGTGRLLEQAAAPVRVGVDVSPGMLARARARRLDVALADAHALPFPDRAFDAIISGKGVFRYLDTPRALAECARVLAPGGVLAIHQFGARTLSLRRDPPLPPSIRHLGSVGDLVVPARQAGFSPREVRRFRPVRIPPYLLEIPGWLDRRSPWQLWSHCVVVVERGR
jgi:ubiquinone/menaquinone biosynthesis C-methylase UbiE